MATSSRVQRFIQCLHDFERSGDSGGLVKCFTKNGEVMNVRMERPAKGHAGIQSFWANYRQAFHEIRSDFTNITERGNLALLEWDSKGSLSSNSPVHYRGVTILEFDGDEISSLRSYFDSAGLQPGHRVAIKHGGLGYAESENEPVGSISS